MKRFTLVLLFFLVGGAMAQAWNDKGHMVIAKIAWNQLTPEERAKVMKILQKHPHYSEFLAAKRPENIPEDEWVFMRAATWSDWVRGGARRDFNRPSWHFINYPIVAPGSTVTPPELPSENVVNQIGQSKTIVQNGNGEEQAIHLCWLFHLVGDVHQPLHCVSFYADSFPTGDRGGNRALLRVEGRKIQLHAFWDDLLGRDTTAAALGNAVEEINALIAKTPELIKDDLANHKNADAWAHEGLAIAKKQIYKDGTLIPANNDDRPREESIPEVGKAYAQEAGATARVRIALAGQRLAQVIREVIALP